ncbi:putative endonuclease [Roseovarius pacificus]|uniref:Putative endonuclease n=1 Tax=Roseovarius pacificus TaxID=337701 RepID=A0A1M6YP29_9RHOB|nr:GIY-YIG nuclease family protein [Roseovarius pacificus]GGO50585.1 excinuclease ABC subunit C [Roseovarius pacificus]SHL20016.1 putative endonuclease [Roseovarius pacificus]
MPKDMYVYIVTNKRHGTLYIGVTNDLVRRVWEHRTHAISGFTDRYNLTRLIWYEHHVEPAAAIRREKALKRWSRDWKIELVEQANPDWVDFWQEISGQPDLHHR